VFGSERADEIRDVWMASKKTDTTTFLSGEDHFRVLFWKFARVNEPGQRPDHHRSTTAFVRTFERDLTMMMMQPNATIYVKNIDWKIKKGILRRALYMLFTRHGKVLEIVALRKDGLRGQAFVVFDTVQAATAALQAENGFTFFGKDLVIEYAREKSDIVAKRDGTYVPKAKRRKLEPKIADESAEVVDNALEGDTDDAVPPPPPPTDILPPDDGVPPSKYLLALDLPADCNEMMLGMLFRQYAGYKEVRMPRPGLAFVEFEDEPYATLAMQALNGFKLTTTDALKLTYGKQ
jgi:U2 small nuclear ribonucleoprotein B''